MAINYEQLEKALYHIRVNYLWNTPKDWQLMIAERGNGDIEIDVFENGEKEIGRFYLSEVIEEIELLQAGKIEFCDLSANRHEDF